MSKLRLAILNSHPIQYFTPLYRRLAQEPQIDLTVYFCSRQGADGYYDEGFRKVIRWDVPLLEGYKHVFLRNLRRRDKVAGFFSLVNPGIWAGIWRNNYDAVWVQGYTFFTDLLTVAAARAKGVPLCYRSEASLTYDRRVPRPAYIRLIKPFFLRNLFRQISAFLAIGSLNEQFYRHYGARSEQIFHVPYTVDNDHFRASADRFRAEREVLRAQLGISADSTVFLFAAKMTRQKAPMELLTAYKALREFKNKALLMVGDGAVRAEAEEFVRQEKLTDVHFVGFVNQTEMPKYYAISDVFVRPDGLYRGDWGLTVNEAMASRLAIISTDALGVSYDLVRNEENGIVVRFGDVEDLSRALLRMVSNPDECRRMGSRSEEMIQQWSYDQCVSGILAALRAVSTQSDK